MKLKKLLVSLIALILMATIPAFSLALGNYGSSAVTAGQTYTLEQMLTYAIQDEYLAKAEYTAIQDAFKTGAPFSNILKAESTHVSLLETLFTTYGITLPENTAATQVTIPASLDEAYAASIQTETANIAMYEAFLAQSDLPEDVRSTFTALENASQNHLNAYTRNGGNSGNGQGKQNGCQGNRNANMANCPMFGQTTTAGQCPMAQHSTANGQCPMNTQGGCQGRMGGRGMMNSGNCTGACGALPQN